MTQIATPPVEVTATWFAAGNTLPALLRAFDRQPPNTADEIFAFALTTLGLVHLRLVRGHGSLFHSPEHVTSRAIENLISYLEAPQSPISDIQLRPYFPDAGDAEKATSFGDGRIGKRDAIRYFREMLEARETGRGSGANGACLAETLTVPAMTAEQVRVHESKIIDLTERRPQTSRTACRPPLH